MTCDAYRNVSSSEILDETLEMYRNETSNNGVAGIIVYVSLTLFLVVAFGIISISYFISGCCISTNSRDTHYSPLTTAITICWNNIDDLGDHSHMSYIAGMLQCFLAALYFTGNNLGPVLIAHGGDIGCTGKCSENAAIITKVISVGAILLLHFLPYLLQHLVKLINDSSDWDYKLEDKITLIGLLGNIIKVNAAYTALTGLTIVSNFCSDTEQGLNWTILFICAFAGAIYITVKIINAYNPKLEPKPVLFLIFVFIFLTVLLSLYLISDNATPLDCAFHCSDGGPSSEDLTHPLLERHCCNIRNNIITRLSLTCFSIAQTLAIAIVAGVVILKA